MKMCFFPALELTRWGDEPNGAKEENRNGHNRFILKTTEAATFQHFIIKKSNSYNLF